MDIFDEIHTLLKRKEYSRVLTRLFDANKKKIKQPYGMDESDINHSWYIVGDIFYKKGQFNKALFAFGKSLKAWKEDAEALMAIGDCYDELKRPVMAERYYRKAVNFANKTYRSELLYNLGNALFDQSKYSEAINKYKLVSKSDKKVYLLAKKNHKLALKKLNELK